MQYSLLEISYRSIRLRIFLKKLNENLMSNLQDDSAQFYIPTEENIFLILHKTA